MASLAESAYAKMDIDSEQPPRPQPQLQGPIDPISIPTTFRPQEQSQDGQDDNSEWEYEYSTTETETFYVTLDLSKEDFRAQYGKSRLPFASRGSWPVHRAMEGFVNRRDGARPGTSSSNSDVEPEPEPEPEGEDENSNDERDATTPPDRDPTLSTTTNRDRVQILDLHTTEPMISYKGRIFTGQWYTNTTTELLLTQHDPHIPLPCLRHLPDSVDLLAASSARINVVEKKLKRSSQERKRALASMRTSAMVLPPVDKNATEERIDQRNFLANLMAIKKRKGETDEVTVIARSMQQANKRSRYLKPRGPRGGRMLASHVYRRIRDEEGIPTQGRGRAGRKKGRRARGKLAWNLESVPLGRHQREDGQGEGEEEGDEGEMLSMPTPAHWGDLEEVGGDGKTTRHGSGGEDEDGDEPPGEHDVAGRSDGGGSDEGSEDRDQDGDDNDIDEGEEDDEDVDVDEDADADEIQYYTQEGDNDDGEDNDEEDEDDSQDSDDTDDDQEMEDDDNEDGEDEMSELDEDVSPS
ncbi:hypothetical protein GGR57DRAFT_508276 [Xylariaceae sp. FL1272]|nr:hypothetical protein GGR57DRAFT_508276 [Xylariaceae sp. FL1272]